MKQTMYRAINSVIVLLLAAIGFSCEKTPEEMPLMYGTLATKFKVTVTTKNVQTQEKIPNLKVKVSFHAADKFFPVDSAMTDAKGEVKFDILAETNRLVIDVNDIDGAERGSYKSVSDTVEIKREDFAKGKEINIDLTPE